MTPQEAVAFVKHHGVVLQAARGPVPNLAEAVAGGPIRGGWWGHPQGRAIFRTAAVVSERPGGLGWKLREGKGTFGHRSAWPALGKVSGGFPKGRPATGPAE